MWGREILPLKSTIILKLRSRSTFFKIKKILMGQTYYETLLIATLLNVLLVEFSGTLEQ